MLLLFVFINSKLEEISLSFVLILLKLEEISLTFVIILESCSLDLTNKV